MAQNKDARLIASLLEDRDGRYVVVEGEDRLYEWEKSILEDVEEIRVKYEACKDPLLLWQAYGSFRQIRLPFLPAWILRELDIVAERLDDLSSAFAPDDRFAPDRPWAENTLTAFGFKWNRRGGSADPFDRARMKKRHILLATRVRVLVDGDGAQEGQNETDACYLISSQQRVSKSTVKRAWRTHQEYVRAKATVERQRRQVRNWDEYEARMREQGRAAKPLNVRKMRVSVSRAIRVEQATE